VLAGFGRRRGDWSEARGILPGGRWWESGLLRGAWPHQRWGPQSSKFAADDHGEIRS